jgi:hypothetical protein
LWKPKVKGQFERHRRRIEDDIKMDVKDVKRGMD